MRTSLVLSAALLISTSGRVLASVPPSALDEEQFRRFAKGGVPAVTESAISDAEKVRYALALAGMAMRDRDRNMALGNTYLAMGNLSKAEATLDVAKSLLTKSQDLARLGEVESSLAELQVARGDVATAVTHHRAAIRLYEQAKLGDRAQRERLRLEKTQSLAAPSNGGKPPAGATELHR